MDIYKYQIWTCNIPGVYTPGCNDAFTMSSTTPSTPAQLQMGILNQIQLPSIPTSSQYADRISGAPVSSQTPGPGSCYGLCGSDANGALPCYQVLGGYINGVEPNNYINWTNLGVGPQILPDILNTLPTLPSWDDLYTSGGDINVVINLYGGGYVNQSENTQVQFENFLNEIDWVGPGAYEMFTCMSLFAECSPTPPVYYFDIVQYPPQGPPYAFGPSCDNQSNVNSGVLFTTINIKSCDQILDDNYLEINVGFDSNWPYTPQVGQTLVVNLTNSSFGYTQNTYSGVCGNICFTIEEIYVSPAAPTSNVDILEYPVSCNHVLCNTNCPSQQDIEVVTLTSCGNNLGEIWGSTELWQSSYEIDMVSVNADPGLLNASQNGDTILVNLNSIINLPLNAPIFWACYTLSTSYIIESYMSADVISEIDVIDIDYNCNNVLCNTYPGTGCADQIATNYDDLAIDCYAGYTPNGSTSTDCCVYSAPIYGCTDPNATNYVSGTNVIACNGYNGNPTGVYSTTGGVPCVGNNGTLNCCCIYDNHIPCPLAIQYGFLGTVFMGPWNTTFQTSGVYDPPGSQWNDWASVVEYPSGSESYWFSPIMQESPLIPGPPGIGSDWFQCEVNCLDPRASNYNVSTIIDCAGVGGGTDYSCCVYDAPCSNQLTIFLEQDFNDIGHYSMWDGEILQKDTFSNFTWSASTTSPWTVVVQNSTEFGFYEDTQGFEWSINWGDGTTPQIVQYPTTELTYVYANDGTYIVDIQMSAPWGITSVSQPLTLPANNTTDPNFDPNPNATFTFNPPGGWATLPMNWLNSDWGPLDSGVYSQDYVTANYTAVPFCFTGITESQLGAFQTYAKGTNNPLLSSGYFLNVPVPLGGQVEMPDGTIQNDLVGEIISVTVDYTAYTISDGSQGAIGYPVTLYDFDTGITIFESCSDGLKQYNMYTIDCIDPVACDICLGEQLLQIMNQTYYINVTNNMGAWDVNTIYDSGDFVYHNRCCWFANGEGGAFSGPPSEPGLIQGNRIKYWYLCPGQDESTCVSGSTGTTGQLHTIPCSECFNQIVTNPLTGNLMTSSNNYVGYYDLNTNYVIGDIIQVETCCYIAAISGIGSSLGAPSASSNPNWAPCPTSPAGCLGGSSHGTGPGPGWLNTDNLINDSYCLNLNQEWVNQGYLTYNAQQIYNVGDVIYYEATTGPSMGIGNYYTPSPNPASVGFSGIIGVPPEPQNVGCYGDGCNPTNLSTDYWRGCAFTL